MSIQDIADIIYEDGNRIQRQKCKECGEKTMKAIVDLQEKLATARADVAREIFEEIERAFFKHYDEQVTYSSPTLPYHTRDILGCSLNVLFTEIVKLKKKYESEGEM